MCISTEKDLEVELLTAEGVNPELAENHMLQLLFLGYWYGFPPCCIDSFTRLTESINQSARWEYNFKFRGTGFIPCKKCNSHKTELHLRTEIGFNRKAAGNSFIFPNDADDYGVDSPRIESLTIEELRAFANYLVENESFFVAKP